MRRAPLSARAWTAIPAGVTCAAVHETNSTNKLALPVWVGEVPGQAGAMLVVEQGRETPTADIWILWREGAAQ